MTEPDKLFHKTYHYLDDTPLHRLWTEAVGKPGYDKAAWRAVFALIWEHCPCGMEKRKCLEEEGR